MNRTYLRIHGQFGNQVYARPLKHLATRHDFLIILVSYES